MQRLLKKNQSQKLSLLLCILVLFFFSKHVTPTCQEKRMVRAIEATLVADIISLNTPR